VADFNILLSSFATTAVFSPTDAAFLALPPEALTTLLKAENVELLTEILTYHVFSGAVLSTDLTDGQEVETLNPAANLTIGVDNTTETVTVTVNNVVVSPADVLADNGVIHVIDQVLLPPGLRLPLPSIVEIATSGDFPTLAAALQSTGLDDVLAGPGPFTVFVPTEGAFAKLPTRYLDLFVRNPVIFASLLFYHIVDGAYLSTDLQDEALLPTLLSAASLVVSINGTIMINDATVVTTDVAALNGVVHVIDTVLFPEGTHPPNVLGLVIATGLFSTFFEALEVTGLDVALAGSGPFTIFIPPEPAFAKLPAGTIESLLLPKNKELLVKILQQHFVYGLFYSSNITDGLTATALNNETLTFSETDAGMTVNGISLVSTDLTVINGVVHVVDEVIIPEDVMLPMSTILETTVADGNFATLSDVLDAAGLMAVLSGPGPFSKYCW
jgi:transforming growth factor-beta-induced protein